MRAGVQGLRGVDRPEADQSRAVCGNQRRALRHHAANEVFFLRHHAAEAEIATLYVLRAAQGRGVGKRLLLGAVRALAAQGARSLMISTLRDNIRGRGFYEHLGGLADPPRLEPGPGGPVWEVAYRWPEIGKLLG